ncbi:hypothetical protein H6G52_12480 [Limnothrix sp. FACHB-881]|nr:hypothetical protein [Limnothrix sp. FACHB-881]MBD2636179.1 hypothetical protein [Limnothrix sp. FACHB-881]
MSANGRTRSGDRIRQLITSRPLGESQDHQFGLDRAQRSDRQGLINQ